MSSTKRELILPLMLGVAAYWPAAALAQSMPTAPVLPIVRPATLQVDAVGGVVAQWRALSQSESYPFSSYAGFLVAHPGFPDAAIMRKSAERNLRAGLESPDQVIAFFRRYPAQTATGNLRFAEALLAKGQREEALAAARSAWLGGALTPEDEVRLQASFGGAIQPGDHDSRMDRLLWERATTHATRQISLTSPEKRPLFDARLAMLTKAPDAAARSAAVLSAGSNDAGFLADRNWWQRNTAQIAASRQTVAAPRALKSTPLDPAKWLEILEAAAKGANNDAQYSTAYNIARQLPDTYPPGTVVNERPFAERNSYTNIAWAGGQAALTKLGRAADAIILFDLYANAAKSAQTRSKGLYWAGRAAEAAGQRDKAAAYYYQAGQFFDQFHGQLALERMKLPVAPSPIRRTVEISGAQRDAFEGSSLVKAVKYLGQTGQWFDQTKFVRAIANSANSDAESVLATELASKIGRPDLAVMIGRNARSNGLGDYLRTAFPQVNVPSDVTTSWTMIHAIARQESQFDRQIVSRAGARGLMQLMPGTARETAPRAGVSYDLASLYEPTYNIRLGSTYFGQLMDRYGGSYVLSVAAYNAGPGNVNKWLAANGDPRTPGTDVLAWIEKIPLSETRDYVQRVLENAVIYDLVNPGRANIKSSTPLSTYLGKSYPG